MHRCLVALLVFELCALPRAIAAQEPPMPLPPPTAAGSCTIAGPLLGPSDFGVPVGQPVADASATLLPDGRVRMYVFAQGRGGVSAVSLTTGGASFASEAGVPRLADGTLVVYYGQFDPQVGGTINLARCPDPGAAAPASRRTDRPTQ